MHWLEAGHPLVSRQRHNGHAYARETPHAVAVQHRYKPPTLPRLLRTFGEQPHNLGTLPITRKNPKLASRLDDDVAGLGHNREPEITAQFSAKAHAPNHQKITDALAYNACVNGGFCAAKRSKSRPVEGLQARNVFDALVRSRSPVGCRLTPQHPCVLQRNPVQTVGPAPIQTAKLPDHL